MFEDLRNAFREAVQNFKDELDRDSVPETVDRLLKGMIDEVTQARARLKSLMDRAAEERVVILGRRRSGGGSGDVSCR